MPTGPGPAAWTKATSHLAKACNGLASPSEFVAGALRALHGFLKCVRVTYLVSRQDESHQTWLVDGVSFPTDRSLDPKPADGLTIFNEALIGASLPKERCFFGSLAKEGEAYRGWVLQAAEEPPATIHTLSITLPLDATEADVRNWKPHAIAWLQTLAHVAAAKSRVTIDSLQHARRQAIDRILGQAGGIRETVRAVCGVWRDLTGAGGVRLWLLNRLFRELDLVHVCSTESLRDAFALPANRLPMESLAGQAIARERVLRLDCPVGAQGWHEDPLLGGVLNILPRLICVPLVSPEANPKDGNPRLVGVIDLHLGIDVSLPQPDDRLAFLGRLSASALVRARASDRAAVADHLNQIALRLVAPTTNRALRGRKATFLQSVAAEIQSTVPCRGLSIFAAEESRDTMSCIYSSDLKKEKDLARIQYRTGPTQTWSVFSSGLSIAERWMPQSEGEYKERDCISPHDPALDQILAAALPGQTPEAATGVVRLLQRQCYVQKQRTQSFSDYDLELVESIAQQISPTLQLIRMQAHREIFMERTSHQVIQPLQGVIAYAHNICDGLYDDNPEKLRRKLRYIRHMARAAAGMMRSSIWASHIDQLQSLRHQERRATPVGSYFIERVTDLQAIRDSEGVSVQYIDPPVEDGLTEFLVDDLFFDQAIQNVLHNAVKYSYPGTQVEVRVRREGDCLTVEITSWGVPIRDAERQRIFGDRERGEFAAGYDPQGTGQGLYIARQIMLGFGGDVTLVESVPDPTARTPLGQPAASRTTFRLVLPGAVAK